VSPDQDRRIHLTQLDALRAIAVLGVMLHHSVPERFKGLTGYASAGGVKLFFVLSGFLITGILLRARHLVDRERETRPAALVRFYARRALRIFPLYYLVVLAGLAIDVEPVRRALVPLVTFTFNLHMVRQGWYEPNYAHFWSLSVEQQFYMVWPWVVLLLPRRWLLPAALLMIATSPVYRFAYGTFGDPNLLGLAAYISTWSSLDALGFGALLAMARREAWGPALYRAVKRFGVPLALAAIVLIVTSGSLRADLLMYDTASGVVFLWLIWTAADGFTGVTGRVLEWKPLLHIGTVSYGAYVYHPFVPEFCIWAAAALGWTLLANAWVVAAMTFGVTLAVATLSWRYIEAPINRIKSGIGA